MLMASKALLLSGRATMRYGRTLIIRDDEQDYGASTSFTFEPKDRAEA